jgi:hypothetical protein
VTPEQEEQVRRALAAAARPTDARAQDAPVQGATDGGRLGAERLGAERLGAERPAADREPDPAVPPGVAARLDDVLAELVAARSGPAEGSRPDELAARRPRNRWNLLVAAAALAVIAAAGGAVATGGFGRMSGDGNASSAGSSTQDTTGEAPAVADPEDGSRALAGRAVPRIRVATLADDLQRVADARPSDVSDAGGGAARGGCTPASVPRGADVVDVRLDGAPAALVLTAPVRGRSTAFVYACDGSTVAPSAPVAHARVRRR